MLVGGALLGGCAPQPTLDDGGGGLVARPAGNTLIAADGRVTLVFPAGAVQTDTPITVAPEVALPAAPEGWAYVPATAYRFGPEGTAFAQPVSLTIRYDEASVPAGVAEASLRLFRVVGQAWEEVAGSSVNGAANTVTGSTDGFSIYGILGALGAPPQLTITPSGGTVTDGIVTLVVPEGAVTTDTPVSVEAAAGLPPAPAGWVLIPNTAFDLLPFETQFALDVEVRIAYDPAALPQGVTEESLRIFELVDGGWELRDASAVNQGEDYVSVPVWIFATFAVFGRVGGDGPVEVEIPDSALEAALRELLAKPSGALTDQDLALFTDELDLTVRGITNLTGIQYCVNVTSLVLWNNAVQDVSPLTTMTGLRSLNLGKNGLADVSPLAAMTGLTELLVRQNHLTDIGFVESLTNLTLLNIADNRVVDLAPLSGLANLRRLFINRNPISDLGPLASLTGLTHLYANGLAATDLSPLQGLTQLQLLTLVDGQVTDIGPLVANAGLGEGDTVDLTGNPLDLSEGSQASQDVEALRERGVRVILE